MIATELANKSASDSLTVIVPAKVNLSLEVLGRRDDGFHEIRSLVIGVRLTDRIICRLTDNNAVGLCCNERRLQKDDNLVLQAAFALRRACESQRGLAIQLDKCIPMAAGLGGGSADAAGTLWACNDLLQTGFDRAALADIGARVGSDVPLFFSLPRALVEGRGERTKPVVLAWMGSVLLVNIQHPVSTPAVYAAWRSGDGAGHGLNGGADLDAFVQAQHADELMDRCFNDLEPAVFRVVPAVGEAKAALKRRTGLAFGLTGAGSTFFHLFDDWDTARETQLLIDSFDQKFRTWVVAAPVGLELLPGKE